MNFPFARRLPRETAVAFPRIRPEESIYIPPKLQKTLSLPTYLFHGQNRSPGDIPRSVQLLHSRINRKASPRPALYVVVFVAGCHRCPETKEPLDAESQTQVIGVLLATLCVRIHVRIEFVEADVSSLLLPILIFILLQGKKQRRIDNVTNIYGNGNIVRQNTLVNSVSVRAG
ncbi:hypothetical protein F4779DRAFT_578396 [Xylariaceae sp. FL0662B]|nr:hypothetical protein F4779DRAFT_578396 [Xylariaceae sp. FL0662B]